MFTSARLKLTAWYLIIIMLVSVFFSFALYTFLNTELSRIERAQQRRVEMRLNPFSPDFFQGYVQPEFSPGVFEEARQRILLTLFLINLGILAFSGAAGYFLAGRTLRPIKEMVDDQNRFVANSSHELRTPLTILKSEIEVYLRGKDHSVKESDELLASNLEEVNNLQTLSDNLIQLAQYEKLNSNTSLSSISLEEAISTAGKKLHKAARRKSITMDVDIEDYQVRAEKESLAQLFGILLDNAIKYSPAKSKIRITTRKNDHFVYVNIEDQGIGIDKKDIPHIFERFYRADSSRTRQSIHGYGLGLSIAKKIVDNYNGSISVKSEVGKGTVFTIQLKYI